MHPCVHTKKMDAKDTKKFNPMKGKQLQLPNRYNLQNQTISPFRLFMERFAMRHRKNNFLQIDRAGFEKWKMMSKEEKEPYVHYARVMDINLLHASKSEAKSYIKVSDGADSAMVGKFDKGKVTNIGSSNSKYGVATNPFSK